ncbi:MAG TPA: hypothetical protein VLA46_03700 [Saprospiraceae bacterium]|nr:hypothetical protein [Saprospiraceae bacterium]
MPDKILPHSRTPNTPELTMEANPDCRVIRLGCPAGHDFPRQPAIRDILLVVQSHAESLLEQLEQHHGNSNGSS